MPLDSQKDIEIYSEGIKDGMERDISLLKHDLKNINFHIEQLTEVIIEFKSIINVQLREFNHVN